MIYKAVMIMQGTLNNIKNQAAIDDWRSQESLRKLTLSDEEDDQVNFFIAEDEATGRGEWREWSLTVNLDMGQMWSAELELILRCRCDRLHTSQRDGKHRFSPTTILSMRTTKTENNWTCNRITGSLSSL